MKTLLLFLLTIDLAWTAATGGAPSIGFNVYRGNTCTTISQTPLNAAPVAVARYLDTTVAAGQSYCYVVKSVGEDGSLSVASNFVTSQPSTDDPCVTKPAATTVVRWSGSKTGKFVQQTDIDERGCAVTVKR